MPLLLFSIVIIFRRPQAQPRPSENINYAFKTNTASAST
ncbi:hypothetical protein TV01_0374 [Neisseria flavescens]|nr:hypothetical protein TV01_0374 [Neisseria flavescens]